MKDELVLEISTGKIRGIIQDDVNGEKFYSFLGIPYANPPVGDLRFKAPQPVSKWNGILDCTKEGNPCAQRDLMTKEIIGSEDCLNLNVYTKEIKNCPPNKLKPVMLFIHGGAFVVGSNSQQLYGPEYLVAEDIVLVTINYRLGLFGFLSFDDENLGIPGNASFKDMILALKWVQSNITKFNGDSNNVTLFGESAGSVSVHLLTLSPVTKGLFHKAICQSGCAINGWGYAKPTANNEIANFFGVNYNSPKLLLEFLQNLSVVEILKAHKHFENVEILGNRPRYIGFVIEKPSKDAFLSMHPWDIIKSGDYNHIPIILGYNNNEGMLFEVLVKKTMRSVYWEKQHLHVPAILGLKEDSDLIRVLGEKIVKFYHGEPPYNPDRHTENLYLLTTDNCFIWGIYHSVRCHAKYSQEPIFFYRMIMDTDLNIYKRIANMSVPGASHADELGYLFKTFITPDIQPGSMEDIGRRRFCKLWTNFAKYGNPTPPNRTENKLLPISWSPVNPNNLNLLEIGANLEIKEIPEIERIQFWDEIYALKERKCNL